MSETAARRNDVVLSAALRVFGRYGYRRTSMDLIARGAGVSRPWLYQYYSNKADIFRSMTVVLLDGLLAAARAATERESDAHDRLYGVLSVKLEFVTGSVEVEYRREIYQDAQELAGDLIAEFTKSSIALISQCLSESADLDVEASGLSPDSVAEVLHSAVNGLVQEITNEDDVVARLHDLVTLTVAALRRRA